MSKYDHQTVETKWRNKWIEEKHYKTPDDATFENKLYVLPQLPYPSGAGLHAGHAEVYTACDIFARFERMRGKKILQAIGWDAFGLPAENYAIKTNIHPRVNTDAAIATFREQIKGLGLSLDYDAEVGSHNPDYYKWTQWFFLLMYKRGLAYRKNQSVNWCESCKTVLANEQVVDKKCERCDTVVQLREMEQWYLKITEYADRLIDDLDKVDWPQETVKRQRDWIGRSVGAQIKFKLVGDSDSLGEIEVFTTAHDTIFGATFVVLAPEHAQLQSLLSIVKNRAEVEEYIANAADKPELERQQQKEKTGVMLEGINAINPANGKKIPVFVADYVLNNYGTGAIMAVPGHDTRDMEFAQKYNLDIVFIAEGADFISYGDKIKSSPKDYKLKDSAEFSGQNFEEGRKNILEKLKRDGVAEEKTTYKLRDWSVSRQRFWGAPIPMVYDPEGNIHPVEEQDLPVILPDDVDFIPTGRSPLTYSDEFQKGVEEKYGAGWKREVDTLDTFMCSSWYFFRYLDPKNESAFASKEMLDKWMPVDFYLGGPEHVNGHLLYSRFFTKVLYDAGYIKFDEPFKMHRHQGIILGQDGRRMSKRWGNVVNPTDVIEKYGGDTLRVYEMFMGPLEQMKAWNESSVQGVRKFIERIYVFAQTGTYLQNSTVASTTEINKLIKKVTQDSQNLKFNTAVSEFMKYINFAEKDGVTKEEYMLFVKLIAPYAPYVAEEIWVNIWGNSGSIHFETWPQYDANKIQIAEVEIGVQIMGKFRGSVKINANATQEEAFAIATADPKIGKHLEGKEVKKVIYVQQKILNIII